MKEMIPIPQELKCTQEWFASIMTQRLGKKDKLNPFSPHGMMIAEEAARYIAPSDKMRPHQRIQIYHQQYWWRLLKTMHTHFPLLTCLFGYQAFNEEIAIPYLLQYPPQTWMLSETGRNLPDWIKENYKKSDLPLIQHATILDWTFTESFIAPQAPLIDLSVLQQGGDPTAFLTCLFSLQPHVHLFQWDYNLFLFREQFLEKEIDYWLEHRFPKLLKEKGKTYPFILYRTVKNQVAFHAITPAEYFFLSLFKKGTTIEAACEIVEQQESSVYEAVATHLQQWFQEWTRMGILTQIIAS